MKGTFSTTCSGVRSSHPSSPQESDDEMRRFSSSIRSLVRATSTPPLHVDRPSSSYCRALSFVSVVISFEWSTGKMKFDAWPVEPPGFGSAPCSISTRSVQSSWERWYARLLPTMPAPMTTACAEEGGAEELTALSLSSIRLRPAAQTDARAKPARPEDGTASGASRAGQDASHGRFEVQHVPEHRLLGAVAVAVADRLEELAVPEHGLLQLPSAVEREVPDPEREDVVLLEGRLEERVVGAAVDLPVDPLVEGH